eukprot:scaffold113207_cov54-Phaeocystis_antarctica.AAC.2
MGAHGPAVLEVSEHGEREAAQVEQGRARRGLGARVDDGEEVEEGLGRVLTNTVTRVEHGLLRRRRRLGHRAHLRVAQHEDVAVALQAAHRVLDRLALLGGGGALIHGEHVPAQPLHRRVERAHRARRRLVEDVREHLVRVRVGAGVRVGSTARRGRWRAPC